MSKNAGSRSWQNGYSNAQNVYKVVVLLNVSHNNESNYCDVKKIKRHLNSFLGTNIVGEAINVDSYNTKSEEGTKENTKTKSATNEVTAVKVNKTFIVDNCTSRKKKLKVYAQAVTDNVEKTIDEKVPCLNNEKTFDFKK